MDDQNRTAAAISAALMAERARIAARVYHQMGDELGVTRMTRYAESYDTQAARARGER